MAMRCLCLAGVAVGLALPHPLGAQTPDLTLTSAEKPAVGMELFASTDSEDFDTRKALARFLWKSDGRNDYEGLAIESVRFAAAGDRPQHDQRIYLDIARGSQKNWPWRVRIGTDGKTVLAAASIRKSDWSKELFVEREIVETRRGVREDIYYTFVGASADLLNRSNHVITGTVGVQEFTGRNERLHVRGSYINVVAPAHGASVQLRARYFRSTAPNEFDYFSPRNYLQLLPVVQIRRFDRRGWMYLAAVGYGAQKATASDWESARLVDFRIESPLDARNFQLRVEAQYANSSVGGAAADYHYVSARVGVTARF